MIKQIGILTSGGGAPGMNAVLYAAASEAAYRGLKLMGIHRGFLGLLQQEIAELPLRGLDEAAFLPGSLLRTARSPEFWQEEGMERAVRNAREAELDGLVVVGGDGTLRGAWCLAYRGVPVVAVPATVSNDVAAATTSVGFDTAVNTLTGLADQLAARDMGCDAFGLLEVSGRSCGNLALHVAAASRAKAVLVPEMEWSREELVLRLKGLFRRGERFPLIVAASGALQTGESAQRLGRFLTEELGATAQVLTIRHVERGSAPTAFDRDLAARMGSRAVQLLSEGVSNRALAPGDGVILDWDLDKAVRMESVSNMERYRMVWERL